MKVSLRREGWHVNAKRIYRLNREEELIVLTQLPQLTQLDDAYTRKFVARRGSARRPPVLRLPLAATPQRDLSMDRQILQEIVSSNTFRLWYRRVFTRECVGLEADRSMTGRKVAEVLERVREERSLLPESITVDNGSEF
jgi:putative transposase